MATTTNAATTNAATTTTTTTNTVCVRACVCVRVRFKHVVSHLQLEAHLVDQTLPVPAWLSALQITNTIVLQVAGPEQVEDIGEGPSNPLSRPGLLNDRLHLRHRVEARPQAK